MVSECFTWLVGIGSVTSVFHSWSVICGLIFLEECLQILPTKTSGFNFFHSAARSSEVGCPSSVGCRHWTPRRLSAELSATQHPSVPQRPKPHKSKSIELKFEPPYTASRCYPQGLRFCFSFLNFSPFLFPNLSPLLFILTPEGAPFQSPSMPLQICIPVLQSITCDWASRFQMQKPHHTGFFIILPRGRKMKWKTVIICHSQVWKKRGDSETISKSGRSVAKNCPSGCMVSAMKPTPRDANMATN